MCTSGLINNVFLAAIGNILLITSCGIDLSGGYSRAGNLSTSVLAGLSGHFVYLEW